MAIVQVVNFYWTVREMTELLVSIWLSLPVEVSTSAAAYPSRAALTAIVLGMVAMRVGSTLVALFSHSVMRLLLAAAALLFALELGVPAILATSVRFLSPTMRESAAEI